MNTKRFTLSSPQTIAGHSLPSGSLVEILTSQETGEQNISFQDNGSVYIAPYLEGIPDLIPVIDPQEINGTTFISSKSEGVVSKDSAPLPTMSLEEMGEHLTFMRKRLFMLRMVTLSEKTYRAEYEQQISKAQANLRALDQTLAEAPQEIERLTRESERYSRFIEDREFGAPARNTQKKAKAEVIIGECLSVIEKLPVGSTMRNQLIQKMEQELAKLRK